jgi:predicted negative regulator of RcsB-dependent stress response
MPKKSVYKAMAKQLYKTNVDDAISMYHDVKTDTINYRVSESDINQLGYLLLNENRVDAATKVFKLNMSEYPQSANVYDSYGDALLMQGDSLQALANFKKCFKMDDSLIYANEKAEALENELSKS